jgi:hypothetical protein
MQKKKNRINCYRLEGFTFATNALIIFSKEASGKEALPFISLVTMQACIPYPMLVSLRSTYPLRSKGRDTKYPRDTGFVCALLLSLIPSKHLSFIPLAAREEIPMAAQKALFYAKKG